MALVVFTGGARSGKSSAAQRLAEARAAVGTKVTVVVFGRIDDGDAEFAERVARHRADRPAGFATVEATDTAAWTSEVPESGLVLVDCLGTLLGLAMEAVWDERRTGAALVDAQADTLPPGFEDAAASRLGAAVDWLLARAGDTIVVTNEVGDGVVPAYATGRLFRDLLGRANRRLVDRADAAYLAVAGRLVDLGTLPREAGWPRDC